MRTWGVQLVFFSSRDGSPCQEYPPQGAAFIAATVAALFDCCFAQASLLNHKETYKLDTQHLLTQSLLGSRWISYCNALMLLNSSGVQSVKYVHIMALTNAIRFLFKKIDVHFNVTSNYRSHMLLLMCFLRYALVALEKLSFHLPSDNVEDYRIFHENLKYTLRFVPSQARFTQKMLLFFPKEIGPDYIQDEITSVIQALTNYV